MRVARLAAIYGMVGVVMFAAGVWLFSASEAPPADAGGGVGGAFELQDGSGRTLTESFFLGKPYAVMFGFTHCPDICPTGLARMERWRERLGEEGEDMRFAFVTVDPERDTPDVLAQYVTHFSDAIVPLSGSPAAITAMLKAYHVYAQKVPLENGSYTMDHHSSVFLFDAHGRFAEFIYYDDANETGLQKLRRLLDSADSWRERVRRFIGD